MKFAVAPMVAKTDKHCRYFYRLLTQNAWLFTEMITTQAILCGNKDKLLLFEDFANKTALQLAGNNAKDLAKCTKIATYDYGYSHVNLNVGCPSNKLQQGNFGAILMKTPLVVVDCLKAMQDNSKVGISVKTRIGLDDIDSYQQFADFIAILKSSGCMTFIIHARKAHLHGLSPKQNRQIPPLKYNFVYKLKKDFPELTIIINGGIKDYQQCYNFLQTMDGVMLGRLIYQNPYFLAYIDNKIYGKDKKIVSRAEVLLKFIDYIKLNNSKGIAVRHMLRHALGLYYCQPNNKMFKKNISDKDININNIIQLIN